MACCSAPEEAMSSLERAIEIALEAHRNQKDRSNRPYILHPLHLMQQMDGEIEMIAAVLHDVVEDSTITLDDLRGEGFATEAIDAVALLTHDKAAMSYEEYVRRIKPNPLARKIKLADLTHNMDLRRISHLDEADFRRMEKYHRAWILLSE